MFFDDTLLKAISWTLLHSVWQGFILALLAGFVILATKKATSALRYNLLAVLFVAFLAVVAMTFNYEFTPKGLDTTTRLNLPITGTQINGRFAGIAAPDFSNTIIEFLNNNANLIAMLWFLIFAVKLIGIFHSLNHIYRIRNYKTFSPSAYWQQRVSELATRIQLSKPIALLESALVTVPAVTGFFKPVILVPIGMLSNLPQDQVEAILLHELAHIRRKDYAINILQHLAEMIFFFNPGLLWLSSLLKDERENCCDDMAIGIIENKAGFVHALVSFEEYNMKNKLAMGFGGNKNHLLGRAKRIIYSSNKSLNAIEKTLLSLSLLAVAIIMIACSDKKLSQDQKAEFEKSSASLQYMQAREDAKMMEADAVMQDVKEAEAARHEAIAADTEAKAADTEAQAADVEAKAAELAMLAPISNVAPAEKATPVEPTAPKKHSVTTRTVTSKSKTAQNYEREVTTYDFANPSKSKHVSLRTGVTGEDLPDMNVDNLTSRIISDLISENVIKSNKNLSYKLSNASLIVNGVKQSNGIHAKLKNKYIKEKMYSICYNYDLSGDITTD